MAKITRIKATDPKEVEEKSKKVVTKKSTAEKTVVKKPTAEKNTLKDEKMAEKKTGKKTFILFRPFRALFSYIRDAWKEIRQVRWPSRKATWKMVLAVLVYTALFVILITLLDAFFSFIFSNIIK